MKKPFVILEALIVLAYVGSFLLKECTSVEIKHLLFTVVALGASGAYMIFGFFFFGEVNPKKMFDANSPKLNPFLVIYSVVCGLTISIIMVATWASLLRMPMGLSYSIVGSCLAGIIVLFSFLLMLKKKGKYAILGVLRVLFYFGLLGWVYFFR